MNRRHLLILALVILFLAPILLYANDLHYKQRKIFTVKGVTFYMLYVPPGKFMMGSPVKEKGHKAEEIQHEATITRVFWIGRTEVTQELYQAVAGKTPSYYRGPCQELEPIHLEKYTFFCQKSAKRVCLWSCWHLAN